MHPLKRSYSLASDTSPIEPITLSPTKIRQDEIKDTPSKAPKKDSFDLDLFKTKFDQGSVDDRYRLIRELASIHAHLPLSAIKAFISNYAGFRSLNLNAFIAEFRKNSALACAKHFGKLGQLEQKVVAEEFKKKVKAVAKDYVPPRRMIDMLFGDFFIRGTFLDKGSELTSCLDFVLNSLDIFEQVYGYSNLEIKKHLKSFHSYACKIETILDDEDKLKELAQEIFQELNTTGNVRFAGGYTDQTDGHALLFHLAKNGDKILFEMYNSGDGLSYHQEAVINEKRKADQILKGTCDSDKLTPFFLTVLLGNYAISLDNGHSRSAEDVYELIINGLRLTPLPGNQIWRNSQRAGTCPLGCILAYLNQHLPNEEFRRVKYYLYEINLALIDFQDVQIQELFDPISKNLYRNIDKLYEKGFLKFNEFFRTIALLNQYEIPVAKETYISLPPIVDLPTKIPDCVLSVTTPQKNSSILGLFHDDNTPLPLITSLKNKDELIKNLTEWTEHLDNFRKDGIVKKAFLFFEEILEAMPSISEISKESFTIAEANSCGTFFRSLADSLIDLEKMLGANAKVYRLYLFTAHLSICHSALAREFPKSKIEELFNPFSGYLQMDLSIDEIFPPKIFHKFTTSRDFYMGSDNKSSLPWFDSSYLYCSYRIGPETPLVKFINAYLRLTQPNFAIKQFDVKHYNQIISLGTDLPEFFSHILDQHLLLLTDIKDKGATVDAATLENGEMLFTYEDVKELRLADPEDQFYTINPTNKVELYLIINEMIDNPGNLNDIAFRKKLYNVLFKEEDRLGKLEAELRYPETQRFLEMLHGALKKQIDYAVQTKDITQFLYLIRLVNDLQDQITLSVPNSSCHFDQLIDAQSLHSFMKHVKPELLLEYCYEVLCWHHRHKTYDHAWLKVALLLITRGANNLEDLFYDRSIAILRYSQQEYKNCYDTWPEKNRFLQQIGFDPNNHILEWPLLKSKNDSLDLTTGRWTKKKLAVHQYKANSDDNKAFKELFPHSTILCRVNNQLVSKNGEIAIVFEHVNNPMISASKLQELYKIQLPKEHQRGYFTYEDFHNFQTLFKLDKFVAWMHHELKIGYIIDKESKRVISIRLGKNFRHFVDTHTQYELCHSNINTPEMNQFNSIFDRIHSQEERFIWKHPVTKDMTIEFPRYSLVFDIAFKGTKISCRTFPGFSIANKQLSWKHAKHGLTLENDKGERLFLLADRKYTTLNQSTLAYQSDSNELKSDKSGRIIALKVISETQLAKRDYQGDPCDLLFFANFLSTCGEWEEAIGVIRKLGKGANDAKLSQQIENQFKQIAHTLFLFHPQYVAYQTHLIYLHICLNDLTTLHRDRVLIKFLKKTIHQYLDLLSNIPVGIRLDIDQANAIDKLDILAANGLITLNPFLDRNRKI